MRRQFDIVRRALRRVFFGERVRGRVLCLTELRGFVPNAEAAAWRLFRKDPRAIAR